MLKKIIKFFIDLFKSKDAKAEAYQIIIENINDPSLAVLHDPDLINRAFEFCKELHVRTDLTTSQKAKIFNEKLFKYGKKVGKVLGTVAINLVRELAYTALKIAITKGAVTLLLADGRKVTPHLETSAPEPQQMSLDLGTTIDVEVE